VVLLMSRNAGLSKGHSVENTIICRRDVEEAYLPYQYVRGSRYVCPREKNTKIEVHVFHFSTLTV